MTLRASFLALLVLLFGFSAANAAPMVRNAKLSALAKTRERDARGRFLPKVSTEAVQQRAYFKFQSRAASGTPGSADGDYLAAKRELQAERHAQIVAAKSAAEKTKIQASVLKLGDAWGAKVTIDKKVVRTAQ